MNNKKYLIAIFLMFSSIANAQNYKINIVLDNNSNKYINSIKNEAQALFSSVDKIDYNLIVCVNDCYKYINNSDKKLVILNDNKKYIQNKNSYIISYNQILNSYDENQLLRASALGIFEFLKENKISNSVYIENKKIESFESFKELKENSNIKKLDLKEIFFLAINNNIQIQQNKNNSKIDKLNIDESKSAYKPQIDFYSNLTQIDSDRAKYSNGLYSEGSVEAGIKLSQVIYSDKILKNIEIKKLLDLSNTNNIKSQNDEILYKVVLSYLDVIKANNYNDIIKIKYNFISQNLDFAKQRVEIGVQDRSDVYRWESELSNANIELSNSQKQLNYLKIELANLLQIDKNFSFVEYGLNSNIFKLSNNDAIKYLSNKKVQDLFLDDIIYSHSKLKQIDELINAKAQELKMNKSSRYLPIIAFEGSAKNTLNRYGVGANATRYWDDNEYQAVINLSLPLYEGGAKSISIEKNEIEFVNLKLQYNNVKSLIEKNVEQDYDSLLKSYEKISYSKTSLDFSKKNYDLIQDKYKNGKENIISLLDAQNAYIVAKLTENISIIDYLQDLSSIYFFSGKIEILIDENKKIDIEEKISKAIKG
ncbi:MAG: TolC family protein [Aliarcobacter sp.]|nr:TolC family protein [Aliarcobacter sp.]